MFVSHLSSCCVYLYICLCVSQCRYETVDRSQYQNLNYNDTIYSTLTSPEKVNTLERNKKDKHSLLHEINALDSAVYGTQTNYTPYNQQQTRNTYEPYSSSPKPDKKSTYESYSPLSPDKKQSYEPYSSLGMDKKSNYEHYSPDKSNYSPLSQVHSPQKQTYESYSHSLDYKTDKKLYDSTVDGYTAYASPHKSNTLPKNESKTEIKSYTSPDGYKTDSYRYESSYQSASNPVTSYSSEKYYTTSPQSKLYSPSDLKRFEEFTKNGTDHHQQHTLYANTEFTSDPTILTEAESLEQRMLKQSVTKKIIEKKSVQMTSSSKVESSTKSFRFD